MLRQQSNIKVTPTPDVIVMVGLPARGKSFMANKLNQYLNWIGVQSQVFNLGNYRRRRAKGDDSAFFRHDNLEAMKIREEIAQHALYDMIKWIQKGGQVALYDATNSTRQRRFWIYSKTVEEQGYNLFFVESICTDMSIIENTIKHVKVKGPDYEGVDPGVAYEDFMKRIDHYEKQYESITAEHLSFMQIYNVGKRIVLQNVTSPIQRRIVQFLINLDITPRRVFLTREGESRNNVLGIMGGDSHLTENGRAYNKKLGDYMISHTSELTIWTSSLETSKETCAQCPGVHKELKALDNIDTGTWTGQTYRAIKTKHKKQYDAWTSNKFKARFPQGESYEDLIHRLEPIVLEIERTQTDLLIVSGKSVLRCLLAYFEGKYPQYCICNKVPLHILTSVDPTPHQPHSYNIEKINLGVSSNQTKK